MKRFILFVCAVFIIACDGSSSGGSGGGGGGTADYYLRVNKYIGNTFMMLKDDYNPVFDESGNIFSENSVARLSVYANGDESSSFIATVNEGTLVVMGIGTFFNTKSIDEILAYRFGNSCSVNSSAKASIIEIVTEDGDYFIYKIGITAGNEPIFYEHIYVDSNVNVNCTLKDGDGGLVDINIALKTGWNEIGLSGVDITSAPAVEEFWYAQEL